MYVHMLIRVHIYACLYACIYELFNFVGRCTYFPKIHIFDWLTDFIFLNFSKQCPQQIYCLNFERFLSASLSFLTSVLKLFGHRNFQINDMYCLPSLRSSVGGVNQNHLRYFCAFKILDFKIITNNHVIAELTFNSQGHSMLVHDGLFRMSTLALCPLRIPTLSTMNSLAPNHGTVQVSCRFRLEINLNAFWQ